MATRIPVKLERVAIPKTYDEPRPYGFGCYGWRSVSKIIVGGELVGFLAMANGWGKKWEIYGLEAPVTVGVLRGTHELAVTKSEKVAEHKTYRREPNGERTPYGTPLYAGSSFLATEPKYASPCKYFGSKESALEEVPDMLEDGYLKPESVVLAEAHAKRAKEKEEAAARQKEQEEYERQRQERAETKKTELAQVTEAFAEMLAEGKISNFQRDAVFLAAKHLGLF